MIAACQGSFAGLLGTGRLNLFMHNVFFFFLKGEHSFIENLKNNVLFSQNIR